MNAPMNAPMNASADRPAAPAPDRRLTPARPDLAARKLEGRVDAPRFVDPTPMEVTVPVAPLSLRPDADAPLDTQLLYGERFEVYDIASGMAWGQSVRDGYVGYVPHACLDRPGPQPTHRVTALVAQVYPAPDMKTRPIGWVTLGARLAVGGQAGKFAELARGGFVALPHIAPLDRAAPDWVAEAERFLGAPYLWGGRSPLGCDCSGLVQLSRQAADLDAPRDSDMQEAGLGDGVGDTEPPRRGDLIFWKGHVGIMLDQARMLHANSHHMAVTIEPLGEARRRIAEAGEGEPTRHARLDSRHPGP